jgi:hypothetical protein
MNPTKQVNDNTFLWSCPESNTDKLFRLKRLKLINAPDIMIKHEIESIRYNRVNTIQNILNNGK